VNPLFRAVLDMVFRDPYILDFRENEIFLLGVYGSLSEEAGFVTD